MVDSHEFKANQWQSPFLEVHVCMLAQHCMKVFYIGFTLELIIAGAISEAAGMDAFEENREKQEELSR